MVNIDTVYQKVLALANKEQRGYITPQEFNLLADKAQLEVFDSYFHEFKMLDLKPKTNNVKSDDTEFVEEKLAPFKTAMAWSLPDSNGLPYLSLPSNLYRLNSVHKMGSSNFEFFPIEPMTIEEVTYTEMNPLTKATKKRMVYVREPNNILTILPFYQDGDDPISGVVNFFRKPTTPKWGYVVVKGKALWNNNTTYTTHFELHPSEEEILVSKIIAMAGLTIMKPEIIQAGGGMEAAIKQSQND